MHYDMALLYPVDTDINMQVHSLYYSYELMQLYSIVFNGAYLIYSYKPDMPQLIQI